MGITGRSGLAGACTLAAALLATACSSSPFNRANHDMILVSGGPSVPDRILVAGGTRYADGAYVPLDTALLWNASSNRYQFVGVMTRSRGYARMAPYPGGRLAGVFLFGGDNPVVDFYLETRCSLSRGLGTLKLQRLRDFAVADIGGRPIVIGGATALPIPTIAEPTLVTNLRSSDTSAEVLFGFTLSNYMATDQCGLIGGTATPYPWAPAATREVHMKVARAGHTATRVPATDRILVIGGHLHDGRAEAFNRTTFAFEDAGSLNEARLGHTATLLPGGGTVLVAGGQVADASPGGTRPTATAELWGLSNAFSPLPPLAIARFGHTAVSLPDGRVLISGGRGVGGVFLDSSEIFDPTTNSFSPGPRLAQARSNHAAILLGHMVYVTGGMSNNGSVNLNESYLPAVPTSNFQRMPPAELAP